MIQTNELRIGNWIIVQNPFRGEAARATVFNILPDDLMVHDESQHRFAADPSTSEPIPLTPEILEAVGFVKHGDELRLMHNTFNLATLEFDTSKQVVYLDFEGTQTGVEIKYLHQLQNIFFTITGNELEIKF